MKIRKSLLKAVSYILRYDVDDLIVELLKEEGEKEEEIEDFFAKHDVAPLVEAYLKKADVDELTSLMDEEDIEHIAEEFSKDFDYVKKLEDKEGKIYVWFVEDKADRSSFAKDLHQRFIEYKGKGPDSMNIVVSEVDDIREFTIEEFKQKVKPYIKQLMEE